jgi:hypothetical protein
MAARRPLRLQLCRVFNAGGDAFAGPVAALCSLGGSAAAAATAAAGGGGGAGGRSSGRHAGRGGGGGGGGGGGLSLPTESLYVGTAAGSEVLEVQALAFEEPALAADKTAAVAFGAGGAGGGGGGGVSHRHRGQKKHWRRLLGGHALGAGALGGLATHPSPEAVGGRKVREFATCGGDCTVRLWHMRKRRQLAGRLLLGSASAVGSDAHAAAPPLMPAGTAAGGSGGGGGGVGGAGGGGGGSSGSSVAGEIAGGGGSGGSGGSGDGRLMYGGHVCVMGGGGRRKQRRGTAIAYSPLRRAQPCAPAGWWRPEERLDGGGGGGGGGGGKGEQQQYRLRCRHHLLVGLETGEVLVLHADDLSPVPLLPQQQQQQQQQQQPGSQARLQPMVLQAGRQPILDIKFERFGFVAYYYYTTRTLLECACLNLPMPVCRRSTYWRLNLPVPVTGMSPRWPVQTTPSTSSASRPSWGRRPAQALAAVEVEVEAGALLTS